jgi:ATP-binding cassette subfamily B protein
MISFLPNLGLAAILLVGGREVMGGSLSVGDFTAFYAYLLLLITPMQTLGYMLSATQRATASGARMFEILDRAPRITEPADAPELPPGHGRVELIHAGLTFEGSSHPALQDATLVVEPGTTVALVGATGSGKTTLVSLLPRLYDATTGSVRIDGADITSVRLDSLRSAIATVNDDPFLFSASVHDNIAYALADASREEVEQAARRARADEFIRELPNGYDTMVGERGLTLSGGQRQRIAIARAILANPRILILDDATSSVDASTEQEIKHALAEVMAGRTTFVISHRLSTIAMADEIVLLDDGRISAVGAHAQLLDCSPLYREMVESGLPERASGAEDHGTGSFSREAEVAGR